MTVALPASTSEMIARAYAEDLGDVGDVTTLATIPEHHRSVAHVIARVPGCMAGIPAVAMCFRHIDPDIDIAELAKDGQVVDGGTVVLQASGSTRSLLTAERVALNVLGQLSGIATATHAFVEAVRGTRASISDTRKTTPGLRALQKYAVAMGGGSNHRMGLYDAALIKDNHLAASDSIPSAVAKTRDFVGTDVIVEVEVDTLEQLAVALSTDADVVLLDNMNTAELASAVDMVGDRMRTEASGGVTMESVREIADTGVDVISVGWLTHSAPALDVAMDLESTIHDQ